MIINVTVIIEFRIRLSLQSYTAKISRITVQNNVGTSKDVFRAVLRIFWKEAQTESNVNPIYPPYPSYMFHQLFAYAVHICDIPFHLNQTGSLQRLCPLGHVLA